jgi:antitoxin (DNA-binding transcriptional repressor) of toxin-antitoxin stability system
MNNIIGLKNLRENMLDYINRVAKGESFIVFKQSKPLFKLSPVDDGAWEEIIDSARTKKGKRKKK